MVISRTKRASLYLLITLVVLSFGFYASMEDYQKDNFSKLIEQTLLQLSQS